MTIRNLCLFLFMAPASLVLGQTDSSSLTIAASPTPSRPNVQLPDQAVFGLSVVSPLNTDLDDIVAALAGSGVTAAGLNDVHTLEIQSTDGSQNCVPVLQWAFTLTVPYSKMKDTAAQLTTLQQGIAQKIPGSAMGFGLQTLQVSSQSRSSQECSIPDLIANARAEAQKLANAAGATVGPILALSDGSLGYGIGQAAGFLSPGYRFPGYLIPPSAPACGSYGTGISNPGPTGFGAAISSPMSCFIMVKFSLMHSQ